MSFKKGHVIDFFKHGNFVIVNGFQVNIGWNWSFCTIQNKKKSFWRWQNSAFIVFAMIWVKLGNWIKLFCSGCREIVCCNYQLDDNESVSMILNRMWEGPTDRTGHWYIGGLQVLLIGFRIIKFLSRSLS